MTATRKEISEWFDDGIAKGSLFMLVVCDSFDYEDYPYYAKTNADCLAKNSSPGSMQRVMEVYDLSLDKAGQIKQNRVMNLPERA